MADLERQRRILECIQEGRPYSPPCPLEGRLCIQESQHLWLRSWVTELEGRLVQLEAKQQTDRRMSEAHDKQLEKLEARLWANDRAVSQMLDRLSALEQKVVPPQQAACPKCGGPGYDTETYAIGQHHEAQHIWECAKCKHRWRRPEQQAAPPAQQPRSFDEHELDPHQYLSADDYERVDNPCGRARGSRRHKEAEQPREGAGP